MPSVVFLHKDLMKTSARNREDHGVGALSHGS